MNNKPMLDPKAQLFMPEIGLSATLFNVKKFGRYEIMYTRNPFRLVVNKQFNGYSKDVFKYNVG
jgi:hypothetical protein